jgi:NADPH:quinone reductase-like Zn-dependent oxidoreductase
MKAVRFHQHGTPSVLAIEEVDRPAPGAGQVLLRVAGAGFNPADNGIRAGSLPIPVAFPHTPGYDVAGTIVTLGDRVTDRAVGDEVVGFLPMNETGAAADYVVAPASVLTRAPRSISLADAAALPSVGLTAWQALFDEAALLAGQRILIVGAGGTVGGYAVQLAKRAGAYVIATASPRSIDSITAAGADEVIDHTVSSVFDAVTDQVDVLLNLAPIDPEEFTALATRVRDGGVVVSTTAWMPTPSDEARDVRSVTVFVRSDAAQLAQLVALVDNNELHIEATRRVQFSELASVHEQSAAGTLRGKVIVVPGS